jgi:hypothetical protein
VGFEPTIPALEREKTVHALDRAATVIGVWENWSLLILIIIEHTNTHCGRSAAFILCISICVIPMRSFHDGEKIDLEILKDLRL